MLLVQMVGGLLVSTVVTWFEYYQGVYPWNTHLDFDDIIQLTPLDMTPMVYSILWWPPPIAGFVFFACFAFTEDVRKEYRPVLTWIRRSILRQSVGNLAPSTKFARSGAPLRLEHSNQPSDFFFGFQRTEAKGRRALECGVPTHFGILEVAWNSYLISVLCQHLVGHSSSD
jgi:hypothetical protein